MSAQPDLVSDRDRRIARAIATLTLPSGLWRVALVLGLPVMNGVALHLAEKIQILGLSVAAEADALLGLALVRPWGERVPLWVPRLGGRPYPVMLVVLPAATGAVTLTVLWTVAICRAPFTGFFDYFPEPWTRVLVSLCYLPLLAWGPLLGALVVSYYRRRRGTRTVTAPAEDSSGRTAQAR